MREKKEEGIMQQTKIEELKKNPQQAKQFNEIAKILDKAVKAEFSTFIKLVQFDTMTELHKLAVKDNISDAENPEKQVTDLIDQIVKQIGTDIEKQIAKKFEEIK